MRRTIILVMSIVTIIGCLALPVAAGPVSNINDWIETTYQGGNKVDQGFVSFSNQGTTTVTVSLRGFGGVNRGARTSTVSGTGTRQAKSGYVDHDYMNTTVIYNFS